MEESGTALEELPKPLSPQDVKLLLQESDGKDSYDDDLNELKFLVSKPTCFVVLGKPGCGKTTLASKIAQNWQCELVSPAEVILQNMEMDTEMGAKAKDMLLRGEAVPEEFVASMLEDKINSPEVAHHGYVLDGIPSMCTDYMSIKEQLELIKSFQLKPDFLVHIKLPDDDLEMRRVGQRVDPLTGDIYTQDVYNPDKPEPKPQTDNNEEEEEETEEEAEEEEEPESTTLPPETVSRLLVRPEDQPDRAKSNIEQYRDNMLKLIEDFVADHDQQYLIELDGNLPLPVLELQTMQKLNTYNIRPAAVPVRLADQGEEEEGVSDDLDIDELMRTLAPKNMVAPRFRWRRSRWLKYCPVALQEGLLIPGKADFACGFLDKVYLMSSPEAYAKFLKNPRPFLMPPQPRPPAKFAVMGPPKSGCTTVAEYLAERYGATIVKIDDKLAPKIAEEKAKYVEQIKTETTETAIETVKKRLKDAQEAAIEAARLEAERLEAEKAERLAQEAAERELAAAKAAEQAEGEGEGSPAAGEQLAAEDGAKPDEESGEQKGEEEAEQTEDDTPKPRTPTPPPDIEVDESHPEVQEIVTKAIRTAEQHPINLSAEVIVDTLEEVIKQIEEDLATNQPTGPLFDDSPMTNSGRLFKEHGGWILDNFPKTREQWALLLEKNLMPDDVIVLKDTSDGGNMLLKRWYAENKEAVDKQIAERVEKEEQIKRQKEEEQRRLEEEERKRIEEEEVKRKSEERQRRIDSGEDPVEVDREMYGIIPESEQGATEDSAMEGITPLGPSDVEGTVDGTVDGTVQPSSEAVASEPVTDAEALDGAEQSDATLAETETPAAADTAAESETVPTPAAETQPDTEAESGSADEENRSKSVAGDTPAARSSPANDITSLAQDPDAVKPPADLPPDGPELEAARERRKEWEREYPSIDSVFSSTGLLEPISIELDELTSVQVVKSAVEKIEKRFEYTGWEYTGMDLDEEEEDLAAEGEGNEEEAEEEEEEEEGDPNRNKKKPLGDFNFFCPVALKEKGVLWPGNPECSAKYREKIYYISNDDNRIKFLENPEKYLNKTQPPQPPAPRFLCLGAKGSGKSLHGRALAKKHGLFHIQFEEKLQEMLLKKTKKKIGPWFEAEEEFKDVPEDLDEDKELDEFEKTFTMDDLDEIKPEDSDQKDEDEEAEAEKEEAEEEAEPEYTEEEEAIKAYLEGGMEDMMPAEILEKIIGEFWEKEPFKTTGFVLEGFPRSQDEVRWMAESGYYSDSAIIIQSEDSDIIGRLLPPKMELWKAKRDRKIRRRQRQKDKSKKIRDKEIEKRRRELVKEKEKKAEEKRLEKEAAKAEMSDEEAEEEVEEEEEEEEEDIEAVLAEEFELEEEEEDEEDETEEDARDRLSNDLAELYDNDTNRLSAVQESLEEVLIPHTELEGGKKPHIIRYQLAKAMRPYIECRESIFERCYPINEKLAERMIAVGYKQPSRFGRWCPVELYDGGVIQPMRGAGFSSFPVIYRGSIYFLSSTQNRDSFCQNPLKYLKQESPKPAVPIRMAIIGPPKSGKTTMAERFESEFGIQRISLGDAIRRVLSSQPKTKLAQAIHSVLKRGETIPDDLSIAALNVALMDMSCSTRGYILDGFPVSAQQIKYMTEASIIPVKVIELKCSNMEIMVRATKDRLDPERTYPRHDSAEIINQRINVYYQNLEQIKQWYSQEHMNYEVLSAEKSKWWMWNEAVDLAKNGVHTIQVYLERISEGKAASIYKLCITPSEFKSRLGEFRMFCPVRLANAELFDCSVTESLQYAVEFRGHYYKCAGQEELDQFLAQPESYVPPNAPRRLPADDLLPKRVTATQAKTMFPKPLELNGYCPVTYLDGKLRYESIVEGNMELDCVLYREKLYCFQSVDKLKKFMRLPEKYWNLKLPHKLPPRKEPVPVTGLPMLGYLEQSVSLAVTKALTKCGCFKPKYPFLTATQSALIYIAYHLKAFNPRNTDYIRKKYKLKLERFEETCNLIRYLGDNMTIRYKEPESRPIDFNHKLNQFLKLRQNTMSQSLNATLQS